MNINISINTNKNPSSVSSVSSDVSQDKNQLSLTTLEIAFNRLFTVLLVLTTIPLLLNIFTLPTVIIFTVFALFLWFGKKYRPFANIIFLIFALGIYFIPIPPIGWGLFRMLKEFRLGGFIFSFPVIFLLAPLIFISFSVRNVLDNIFTYFKTSMVSRNVFYFISLFIVLATLLAYPFFDSVKLRDQSLPAQGFGDLSTIVIRQSLTFIDRYNKNDGFTSRFDTSTKKYIYRLRLLEPLNKDLQFKKIEADGEKINFITDNRVECSNCQKDISDPFGLVFPAGKDIDFIISSDQLIKAIKFTEPGDKVADFVFWK